jgi:hypothetical protein
MHDRLDHDPMKYDPRKDDPRNHDPDEAALGAALRALPDSAPPRNLWPEMASRVRRRGTVRRTIWFTLPAAFAAGVALTLAWPQFHRHAPSPAFVPVATQTSSHAPTPAANDLGALQASSQQWQAWVQKLDRDGAPLDGRQLTQAVALQDRIGLVDLQLSAARNPSTTADLWQQRITLLQQLGLLHLQPYLAAAQRPAGNDHLISM